MSTAASHNRHMSVLQTTHNKTLVELEYYKLLVESVEDYAIFLMDPQGYIMTWNKGAELNKGYKDTEIIGKHFSSFYLQHDIDNKKPERELEIAEKIGRIEDEDWRVRKDGTQFWANVIITALRSSDGELIGFAKVTRDLTERKQQEDSLRDTNILLKKKQEELQQLNASKDEFISLASHQLRTPATAVKQLLGLLIEGLHGDLPTDQLTIIQKAYESNERQISLVNSLLKVAQLDAGKTTLQKVPTVIDKLIRDIIDEQSDTIAKRNQTIIYQNSMLSTSTNIDTKYFRMAIENLIDNASKYTHRNGEIIVSVTSRDDTIVITIKDNGVGIDKKDFGRLFEKFNRIPNDLSQKVSGSGLGLYWVKEIISMHGGAIRVESALGKGTKFAVHIPVGGSDA